MPEFERQVDLRRSPGNFVLVIVFVIIIVSRTLVKDIQQLRLLV